MSTLFQPGKLVTLRGRDWVVLPSDDPGLLMVKPLGGSDDEATGIYLPLEIPHDAPKDARFAAPTPDDLGDITTAIRRGLDRVRDINVKLIADVVRDSSVSQAMHTLETVAELRDYGVIGIGLGGSEQSHPPEKMTTVFARARQLGLHTTVHAGEAAGAPSIWGAIHTLHAERIGHAARATEDPSLCAYLRQTQLPLEMCPLSNMRTGVVATFADHPVVEFIRQGMLVTINTDDPKMFNNTLADEYTLLMTEGGLHEADICALIDNAIRASWLSDAEKTALRAQMHAHPDWC